jgi:hypothetical protein
MYGVDVEQSLDVLVLWIMYWRFVTVAIVGGTWRRFDGLAGVKFIGLGYYYNEVGG